MRENAPSATAYLIAASIACSAREPEMAFLVPAHAAALSHWALADGLPHGRALLWALEHRWFRAAIRRLEAALLPGIQTHYLVRKRAIEDAARQALEAGIRQVVVLGAGFDSLCQHLHTEYSTCLFFEMDHPGTQRVKQGVLERRVPLRPNLRFLPIDFTVTDLETELRACPRFRAGLPTLFIMEGLLMYLSPEEVARLFHALGVLAGPDSQTLFTFLEPQPDGSANFPHASPLVSWWLKRRGERFRWGISRDDLPGYLAENGFHCDEILDEGAFRCRYLTAPFQRELPLAEGELLCRALRQRE
jgi:methyltransferase (TIGR00027 family)